MAPETVELLKKQQAIHDMDTAILALAQSGLVTERVLTTVKSIRMSMAAEYNAELEAIDRFIEGEMARRRAEAGQAPQDAQQQPVGGDASPPPSAAGELGLDDSE